MRYASVFLIAAALFAAAPALNAQTRAPERAEARASGPAQPTPQAVGAPNVFDVQLIGGLSSQKPPSGTHAVAGAMARAHFAGWGVLGLGMLGSGGDYDSRLYGGALSRRVVGFGPADVAAFGGYGYTHEKYWTGRERGASGILVGAIASVDLRPLVLSVAFSDLVGRYDAEDVDEPFSFHVPRVFLGIGF